jgi:hypothetical protein
MAAHGSPEPINKKSKSYSSSLSSWPYWNLAVIGLDLCWRSTHCPAPQQGECCLYCTFKTVYPVKEFSIVSVRLTQWIHNMWEIIYDMWLPLGQSGVLHDDRAWDLDWWRPLTLSQLLCIQGICSNTLLDGPPPVHDASGWPGLPPVNK